MKSITKSEASNNESRAEATEAAKKAIKAFISIKYLNYNETLASTMFNTLLESHFDHQSTLSEIAYTSLRLLAGFAKPEIRGIFSEETINAATKLCEKLTEFTMRSQDEHAEALLDLEYLDYCDSAKYAIRLAKEYNIKTKLAIYEKQLNSEAA